MSEGAARALGDCMELASCSALREQAALEAAIEPCLEAALDELPVTPRIREFCRAETERYFECGWVWARESCEQAMTGWNDSVLRKWDECRERESCENLQTCEESATQP